MPLLDEIFGVQERVLSPREALDARRRGGANEISSLLDELRKRTPAQSAIQDRVSTQSPSILKPADILALLQPASSQAVPAAIPTATPSTPAPIDLTSGQKTSGKYGTGNGSEQLRNLAKMVAASKGWDESQFRAWDALINAESSWNPSAQNPTSTAFGLGQFLDSTWKSYGSKTADPALQLQYMAKYIEDRYGTPQKALAFHQNRNWY